MSQTIKKILTDFEIKRIQYLISQGQKQTVIGLSAGDAEILSKVLNYVLLERRE